MPLFAFKGKERECSSSAKDDNLLYKNRHEYPNLIPIADIKIIVTRESIFALEKEI